MVKSEKYDHLHLIYHFTVLLNIRAMYICRHKLYTGPRSR